MLPCLIPVYHSASCVLHRCEAQRLCNLVAQKHIISPVRIAEAIQPVQQGMGCFPGAVKSYCMLSMMAFVNSEHFDLPPKSPVMTLPSAMVSKTAFCAPNAALRALPELRCHDMEPDKQAHGGGHGGMCTAQTFTSYHASILMRFVRVRSTSNVMHMPP